MTKPSRKLFADLPDGAPLVSDDRFVIERAGRKFYLKEEGLPQGFTWLYKTADYTLKPNEGALVNGNGSAVTITAPATIAAGEKLAVANIDRNATPALVTLARNGKTLNYAGQDVADDISMKTGELVWIVCSDSSKMEII